MSAFFISRIRIYTGLFIACLTLVVPVTGYVAECSPDRIDEHAKVAYIYDGDTLRLDDGRRVRIIGINTPEMGSDENPPETLAKEARDELLSLLPPGQMIGLRYGIERHDRYNRLLAHVFINENINVGEHLLQRGLAVQIVIPPNTWHFQCYWEAEQQARLAQSGIWSPQVYSPLETDELGVIDEREKGFQFITGRVSRTKETNKSIWLILDGDVALRIAKDELHYFKNMDLLKLVNHKVVARGWLTSYKDRPYMRIRHPISLQVEDK